MGVATHFKLTFSEYIFRRMNGRTRWWALSRTILHPPSVTGVSSNSSNPASFFRATRLLPWSSADTPSPAPRLHMGIRVWELGDASGVGGNTPQQQLTAHTLKTLSETRPAAALGRSVSPRREMSVGYE